MISLLVSSREKDRKNFGKLINFLSSIKESIYDVSNIEIIFKFDKDDDLIEQQLIQASAINPDINIKYFFSDRYGYLGLHKAYYECIKHLNKDSYIIMPMADDFMFKKNSHWDKILLDKTINLKDKPFIVQDGNKIGKMHDVPIFSKKVIELVTLGNSLSVDGFLVELCDMYLKYNLNDYIITLPEFTTRQSCAYDRSYERWNLERNKLIEYLESQEHKDFLNDCENKLKTYFNI